MNYTKETVIQLLTEMARVSKNLLAYHENKRIDCKLSDGLQKLFDYRDLCQHLCGEFNAYSTAVEILKDERRFNELWNIYLGEGKRK